MEASESARESAEARLVQRAKERSPSAWAEIYDAHYPKLYRYCYARTTDPATAADLASKVFLEALEGIDRYVYRGRPLLAWLYRIARNVTSDHLRAWKRESEALHRAADALEPHDPGPAAQVTDRRDVLAALHQLTDDQQQVVALRYYADFSTAEIAHAMERSERAVYSLEVRALAALRRLLAPGRMPEPDEQPGKSRNPDTLADEL
jgi:RNA polymerase sigma-70 factor (ECF subfamily)